MTTLFDTLRCSTRGVVEREGVPRPPTSPFEMDEAELAAFLADAIGRVRGAELTTDEIERLEDVVAADRAGVERWMLRCYADLHAKARVQGWTAP